MDHAAKRPKLSPSVGETTLVSQIEAHHYTCIEQVKVDIDTAVSAVIDDLQGRLSATNHQPSLDRSRETVAQIRRATALKLKFDNLILTEITQRSEGIQFARDTTGRLSGNVSADEAPETKSSEIYTEGTVRLPVLTLYGGGPQPKQLFSSLQQPLKAESRSLITPDLLREETLPNGISTSKVIPVHSIPPSEEKKTVPTLGDLFPPPPTLQLLNPPRQSRLTGARAAVVTWVKASEPIPSSNTHRRTYPQQPLATSQWLAYNTVSSPIRQASSEERRRQRDRALGSGEPQPPLAPVKTRAAHSAAKEDALFSSAYTSFAPVKDSTGSIVPDHSKETIWWKRSGEKRYREFLHTRFREPTADDVWGSEKGSQLADVYEDEISKIVESWTPTELPRELMETKAGALEASGSTSEMDILIGEISELLETLNSYQRVRNLSLANSALTTANPELSALSGSPASPSTAEYDVYSMLQSQLALIISTLPPYAVAKLDGNRLGVLNASTKIPIEGKSYAGTIEEDELPTKTRAIGTSAAVGYSPRPTNVNSALPARVNGYTQAPSTPAQAIPRSTPGAVPRAPSTSTPQLPNQQYSSRPASSNHYFTGTAHSSYPPQRSASMTAERYAHPKPPQYGQRPAQPPHTPLPNGYRAHPSPNGLSHSQAFATPPHGMLSPATVDAAAKSQRPSQPGYQQKAMNAVGYPFGSSTPRREASPSKNKASLGPPPRLPPTTPGPPTTQPRPPVYHPQPQQPVAQNSGAQPVNGNGGSGSGSVASTAQSPTLTRAEQEALMNSQKVRLAQHEVGSRQGSGTPQPPSAAHRATPNRPAVPQPNGV